MLLYGFDKEISNWVSQRIGYIDFGLCTAIGVARNNTLVAGIVYSNYIKSPQGHPISIEISMNSIDKRWCSRDNLNALLSYPFIQLGVKRVQSTCAKKDKTTRKFLERLGFTLEGVGRKAWPLGGDCTVYSLLRHECRWLKECPDNRKIGAKSPCSPRPGSNFCGTNAE